MTAVTVSSKYQIVIPREIREAFHIEKGQRLIMINMGGVIELIPERPLAEMQGAFPGISLDDIRDETDRF